MNEQIRELAEQAGAKFPFGGFVNYDQFDCEKFAELIVQECANLVNDNMDHYNGIALITPAEIKQHFGVE